MPSPRLVKPSILSSSSWWYSNGNATNFFMALYCFEAVSVTSSAPLDEELKGIEEADVAMALVGSPSKADDDVPEWDSQARGCRWRKRAVLC
mmetsp:Transcript_18174/g.35389  ORF Transcript_18174/g.35389 Transcript_18174/m.35389 type:complete len:92 (+) Transcript_18174:110-385(+)